MIEKQTITKSHARSLIQGLFADLSMEVDQAFVRKETEADSDTDYQAFMWAEMRADAKHQLSQGLFDANTKRAATAILAKKGLNWETLDETSRASLLHGVARAFVEQANLYEVRKEDLLAKYIPADSLFAVVEPQDEVRTPLSPPVHGPVVKPTGPTLNAVVQDYLRVGKTHWTQKTLKQRVVRLNYLADFIGGDEVLSTVTVDQMREFSRQLQKLRRNKTGFSGSFFEKQTENEKHRISLESANQQLTTVKAFFNWAVKDQGYIEKSPAENITIKVPKKFKVANKPRRAFSEEELRQVFSAPIFTGCAGPKRPYQIGTKIFKNAHYWLPILAYYTGARSGELIQLHLSDLKVVEDIPYIAITTDGSGEFGQDDFKSLKTIAASRNVPLHPHLIELGFLEFVKSRRRGKYQSKRLFHEIALGKDGQASTVYSKRFAYLLDSLGLTDPALVFHSFRHCAEDAFRNAMISQKVIDGIIGHDDGATSSIYGDGVWLETAYEAVKHMKLRVNLPDLLG